MQYSCGNGWGNTNETAAVFPFFKILGLELCNTLAHDVERGPREAANSLVVMLLVAEKTSK